MAKRLVCVASAFGYGPVSTLLAVAKPLKRLGYELVFVGRGLAQEFAAHFPFDRVLTWKDASDQDQIEQELLRANGIVNVSEPRLELVVRQIPIPHFYIDILFWMWSRLNPWTARADIYFIQNFSGVKDKLSEWRANMRNPQIVGPIVDLPESRPSRGQEGSRLIINFGGLESSSLKEGQEFIYAHTLTRLLLPLLDRSRFESILFTGNVSGMANLERQFPEKAGRIQFAHLSHETFVAQLGSAELLLSSPGLTATYEAFLLNAPVRFLPPQNYSQTLMLDYYGQSGLSDYALHWKDLYPGYQIGYGEEVSAALRTIQSTLNTFTSDLEAQQKASQILTKIITEPFSPMQRQRQAKFARVMGQVSPSVIAHSIDAYLG